MKRAANCSFIATRGRSISPSTKKAKQNSAKRHIHIWAPMASTPADSIREFPFVDLGTAACPARKREIEDEVIRLFDQFRTPLLRYALSLGLSVHDGEEVVQEVFLALFRHLHLGRPRENLRGWMFRVAHNLSLKHRREARKLQGPPDPDGTLMATRIDTAPNPEEQALSAQRQIRLMAVLNALPEQDQMCLRLRAEGLRYREIARTLGISLGSVSISLTRSLARLVCADKR
jgi:RNA polymerase sigma-70 factor, ECF subfamily